MNLRIILLILAVLPYLNSCVKCRECCDGMTFSRQVESASYGTLRLDSNKANWIPNYQSADSVVLVNSVGGAESYLYHYAKIAESKKVDLASTSIAEACGFTTYYAHSGITESEALNYSSFLTIIQKLQVSRAKSIDRNVVDGTQFLNTPEYFRINWNNIYFSPDLNTYSDQTDKKFHLSLTLNGHNYDSVFECYKINADPDFIGPEGFYYSKKEGFLGFYISRHLQEWLRK
ncbi:MAG: hypothetical protein SGJ00_13295 [bacterium]|nr:hypothetical protein [bacterium]